MEILNPSYENIKLVHWILRDTAVKNILLCRVLSCIKINPSQSYYKTYIGALPAKWFANELYNIAIDYQEVNISGFILITYNILISDLPFGLSVLPFELFNHV